ncbi:MAG: hypothetical protein U1E58_08450 [Tabrizicola sp.]
MPRGQRNGHDACSRGWQKFDLEAASAANTESGRLAKNRAIKILGLDDGIEDILITLGKQYHLIRPMEQTPTIFLYVALDREIGQSRAGPGSGEERSNTLPLKVLPRFVPPAGGPKQVGTGKSALNHPLTNP